MKSLLSSGNFSKGMVLLLSGVFLAILNAHAESFGRLISFGDSLSDTGNVFAATGGALPPAPYHNGRFSNGIVWSEYLAQDLDVDLVDYAYGGAFTNDQNLWDYRGVPGLPGLSDQVMLYLFAEGFSVPEDDLITVVAGSNDFFALFDQHTSVVPVPSAALNALGNVQLLIQSGAQHIVVLGVPDLSSTPAFAGSSKEQLKQIRTLVKTHNTILKKGLYDLRKAYKVDVVYFNFFEELNTIIENPYDYGITDTSTPGIFVLMQSLEAYLAQTFMFWDTVHPTTTGHRLIADAVMNALIDHYDD